MKRKIPSLATLLLTSLLLVMACANAPHPDSTANIPKHIALWLDSAQENAQRASCAQAQAEIQNINLQLLNDAQQEFHAIIQAPQADTKLDLIDARLHTTYALALKSRCLAILESLDQQIQYIGYPWLYTKALDTLLTQLQRAAQTLSCEDALLLVREINPSVRDEGLQNLAYLTKRGIPINTALKINKQIESLLAQTTRCPQLSPPIEALFSGI